MIIRYRLWSVFKIILQHRISITNVQEMISHLVVVSNLLDIPASDKSMILQNLNLPVDFNIHLRPK